MILRIYFLQGLARVLPQVLAFGVSIAIVRTAGISVVGQYGVVASVATLSFGLAGSAIDMHALRQGDLSRLPATFGAKIVTWFAALPLVVAGGLALSISLR